MIEALSQSVEASEVSLSSIADCHISSASITEMKEILDLVLESADKPNNALENSEVSLIDSNLLITKLEPRASYFKESHLYETDDRGNIYKCDGNLIQGIEYYDNGGRYKVDANGNVEVIKEGYYSSRKERLDRTPVNGERGKWEGEPGESKFKPSSGTERGSKAVERLFEYGLDGIEYKDALPDFSKCCIESVEIEMTEVRYLKGGNFEKADTKCASKWNEMNFENINSWSARNVAEYRFEHNYTWHECEDRKTCQMISRDIHDYFGHSGGVSECKKRLGKNEGGGFDD